MRTKSAEVTAKHINRVRELIGDFNIHMSLRAHEHDQSKFNPIESKPLEEMQRLIEKEGQAPYGSDEYKRRTKLLGPMLEHHYANNSHHPEHYENGVSGMDLFDLVEMFFDWKAASERGEESSMSLSIACEKYKIDPMLQSILQNTANKLGYVTR